MDANSHYPWKSKITLGLDLQGGLYIVLGIDFVKIYKGEVQNYLVKAVNQLQDQGIAAEFGAVDLTDSMDPKMQLLISNPSEVDKAETIIRDYYRSFIRLVSKNSNVLTYGVQKSFKEQMEKSALEKSIEVIRNRIDQFGVNEPDITSLGEDKLVVQLPGVKDVEKAKDLIGKTAKLEFRFVNDSFDMSKILDLMKRAEEKGIKYTPGTSFTKYNSALNDFAKAELPANTEILFEKTVNPKTFEIMSQVPYLVETVAPLTGDDLQDANVGVNQEDNSPYISVSFKTNSAKIFADVTEKNIGRRMAIILDGNIYSAPSIRSRIPNGEAQITLGMGSYDDKLKEAKDLSLILRAGALPVELEFQEQRIVGPSLGADSIDQAKVASIVACLLVFVFMILYYRLSGFIAVVTLVINVLLTLMCLVCLGATLTLPGIGGIALTVGMAVDGNIIIYERIRDELSKGLGPKTSVDAGFSQAFWTILDANITTFIAGLALINFGTGPVRGFAVTLIIGVIVTVYTSYYVSEIMFEYYMKKSNPKKLSI
jgi:protein-export membrane protein SecD